MRAQACDQRQEPMTKTVTIGQVFRDRDSRVKARFFKIEAIEGEREKVARVRACDANGAPVKRPSTRIKVRRLLSRDYEPVPSLFTGVPVPTVAHAPGFE